RTGGSAIGATATRPERTSSAPKARAPKILNIKYRSWPPAPPHLLGWCAWRRLLDHTDRPKTGEVFPKKCWVRTKIQKRLPGAACLGAAVRREEWDGLVGQANRIGALGQHSITEARGWRVQENNGLFDAAAAPFLQEFLRDFVQERA